jgi:hypothetical protein
MIPERRGRAGRLTIRQIAGLATPFVFGENGGAAAGRPARYRKRGVPMMHVTYTVHVEWSNGQAYDYEGYRSSELAISHHLGFLASSFVKVSILYRVYPNGTKEPMPIP